MNTGSIFRKWDLHVHTPESYMNSFVFDDQEDNERHKGDIWDKYIKELESVKGTSVIGITDYFTIAGYRKVLDYKKKGRLNNFDLILPNIEFRLDKFVQDKRLNFHVILSDEVNPSIIEKEFLEALTINNELGEHITLSRENIEHIGSTLKKQQKEFQEQTDYYTGCINITVSLDKIVEVLEAKSSFFKGKYLLVLVGSEWNEIDWRRQDHLTRKVLLVKSHAIFSSNESTRNWGLGRGKGYKKPSDFIDEFGSLKPCIHGSDAHCFGKLCKPEMDRFCWIKANPSFEGLKQVLYEPEDRVRICSSNPEPIKNIYSLKAMKIDECEVNKELKLCQTNIDLNTNMVTVIGGKGSGKTALLDLMANCFEDRCLRAGINPVDNNSFVQRIEDSNPALNTELEFIGEGVDSFSKGVLENSFFKDIKVTYLPQGRIEELSSDRGQLNRKIQEIIFNRKEIVEANLEQDFSNYQKEIKDLGQELKELNTKIFTLEQESSSSKLQEIEDSLSRKSGELRDKQSKLKSIVESMTDESQEKIKKQRETERVLRDKGLKINTFGTKSSGFIELLKHFQLSTNKEIEDLNTLLIDIDLTMKIPSIDFKSQLDLIDKATVVTIKIDKEANKEIESISVSLKTLEGLEKLQSDILEEIIKINEIIEIVRQRKESIEEQRKEIKRLEEKRLKTFQNLIFKYEKWGKLYERIIQVFSKDMSEIMSGIEFESNIHFNIDWFVGRGTEILDLRSVVTEDIRKIGVILAQARGDLPPIVAPPTELESQAS